MSESVVRTRRWSRLEYDRLIEEGVFQPGERLGQLTQMVEQKLDGLRTENAHKLDELRAALDAGLTVVAEADTQNVAGLVDSAAAWRASLRS